MADVTRILTAAGQGDALAANELLPLVYDELRRIAAVKMAREQPGQTLEATALVHEAYLRLVDQSVTQAWNHRGHFFLAAAEAMRRILIDRARQRQSLKAGGAFQRHNDNIQLAFHDHAYDLIALDDVIAKLEREDPRKAKIVKLRFFTGMTADEAAAALGISAATANSDWAFARAWLKLELEDAPAGD